MVFFGIAGIQQLTLTHAFNLQVFGRYCRSGSDVLLDGLSPLQRQPVIVGVRAALIGVPDDQETVTPKIIVSQRLGQFGRLLEASRAQLMPIKIEMDSQIYFFLEHS